MNPSYELPKWFGPVFKSLLIEVFILLSLGATVRVLNAGLACPDWPLCFGDYVPDFHPQVYLEFIHRVLAGLIAIVSTVLVVVICRRKAIPFSIKFLGILTILLLAAQVILGGLTVLWQLDSKVVAAHLTMGTTLYAILLWIYLSLKPSKEVSREDQRVKPWALAVLAFTSIQIVLGGLVASHYAALVCTDFPKCFGQWFPTFSGIIGLHVIHRTFAYLVVIVCVLNWIFVRTWSASTDVRWSSNAILAVVGIQFLIGIANVVFHTPPLLAVLHLTGASALLGFAVYAVRRTTA